MNEKGPIIEKIKSDNGVFVESNQHDTNEASRSHSHPEASFIYVAGGKGVCSIEDVKYTLTEGTLLVIPAYSDHLIISDKGHQLAVFVVFWKGNSFSLSPVAQKQLLNKCVFHFSHYKLREVRSLLRGMLHEQEHKDPEYESALSASLNKLLISCLRQPSQDEQILSSEERVDRVLKDITKNYHIHINAVDAAKLAHLSQRQFSTLCHKISGKSYVNYINQIRTQKAKELLESTTIPVTAIAFEVGYEELSTFYRAFKKEFNKAPTSYRN